MDESLRRMSDDELDTSLKRLAQDERDNLVAILKHLAELDDRRSYKRDGFSSLFDYCQRELHYAEGEAARRIHVARAAKGFPSLYVGLEHGKLTLTAASFLAPHLTRESHRRLIRRAWGRTAREVEAQVAALTPVREPRERARFLLPAEAAAVPAVPVASPPLFGAERAIPAGSGPDAHSPPAETIPQTVVPAPLRVHFSFTGAPSLLESVERAKALLRSKYAAPGLEEVFTEAVSRLLRHLDPVRTRRPAKPQPVGASRGRSIPRAVKDEVWLRDGGRCRYEAPDGRRCEETATLQYDHIVPWSMGGMSEPANLRLLCRSHNGFEARRAFGDRKVDEAIAAA